MTKISDLTALTGAGVDEAADLFPIVDMSAAGAARNKKITVAEAKIALDVPTAITELDDVPDVNAPTPSNGDVLTWDSTPGEWVSSAPAAGVTTLDGLTDVNAPTPGNGEVLTWDSTPGEWVSQALPGAGTFVLDDATDVDAPAPADGDVLTWVAADSEWQSVAPPGGGAGGLIGQQIFTSGSGTYTPTVGTSSVVIEMVGGGGGGSGIASPGSGNASRTTAGSGAGYVQKRLTANFSGASYSVGAAGTGGAAGANSGTNGGDSTFTDTAAVVYTAGGGVGGATVGAGSVVGNTSLVTAGGTASNGDLNIPGGSTSFSMISGTSVTCAAAGGSSKFSNGADTARVSSANTSQVGTNAGGYGGGGGPAAGTGTGVARAGGDGSPGIIIIWEYS